MVTVGQRFNSVDRLLSPDDVQERIDIDSRDENAVAV
jgi:hypothetical protein